MKKIKSSQWELVNTDVGTNTERLDVPGGYLYKTIYWIPDTENVTATTMCFVPDEIMEVDNDKPKVRRN